MTPHKTRRKSHEIEKIRQEILALLPCTQAGLVRRLKGVSFASIESCIRSMRKKGSANPIHVDHFEIVVGQSRRRAVFVAGPGPDASIDHFVMVEEDEEDEPDPVAVQFQMMQQAFFSIPPSGSSSLGA